MINILRYKTLIGKKFLPLIVVFMLVASSKAQTADSLSVITETDDSTFTNSKYDMVMLSTNFMRTAIKYSDNTGTKVNSLLTDVYLYQKSGLFAGVAYNRYFAASENTYEVDVKIGYDNLFSDWFNLNASYNYHRFAGDEDLKGLNYTHQFNIETSANYNFFTATVSNSFIPAATKNNFTDFAVSGFFSKENVLKKNDYFSVNPQFGFSLGTDNWLFTQMTDFEKMTTKSFLHMEGFKTNNFGFLSTNFSLPFSYSAGNIMVGATFSYSIPTAKFKALGWANQSGLVLSFSYSPTF